MTRKDKIKIFLIALIVGTVMGIIVIQIFQPLTVLNILMLEVSLLIIIPMLFIASKWWNKRLENANKDKEKNNPANTD